MNKFKCTKLILKISIIVAMIVLMFFINKADASNSWINGNGNITLGEIALWAKNTSSDFINTSYKNFLGKIVNYGYGNSLLYNTSQCLYEMQTNYSVGESFGNRIYRVVNVIDFDMSSDGYYSETHYLKNNTTSDLNGNEQTSPRVYGNEYTGSLAASLYNSMKNGQENASNSSQASRNEGRREVICYWRLAYDNGGVINIDSTFTKNVWDARAGASSESIYPIQGWRTSALNNVGTSLAQYKEVKVTSTSQQVVSCTSSQTVLGPFKVSYGGKGIESVSIDGASSATIQYATTSNASTWNNVTGIPNNTNFYLKITNADLTKLSSIKVTFNQQSITYYKARMLLLRSANGAWQGTGFYRVQNMTYFAAIEETKKGSASCTVQNAYGSITINKTDANTGAKLEGIGFTIYDNHSKKYVKSDGTETTTETILYTNSNGVISISKINLNGNTQRTFTVTEKASNNLYYKADSSKKVTKTAVVNGTVTYDITNTKAYSLTVQKQDNSGNTVNNVGFRIKYEDGTWLNLSNGTVSYVSEANAFDSSSKTWKIGELKTSNGILKLSGLKRGKYTIYETSVESPFYLENQNGYENNSTYNTEWVKIGDVTVNDSNTSVTKTIVNIPNVSVSGYVWVDEKNKTDEYNSRYDISENGEAEKKLEGVKVDLIKKGETEPAEGFSTVTDSNGNYTFDGLITYNELNDYYVRFDYSGLTINNISGKEFIPVAYNDADLTKVERNGSRAMSDSIAEKDVDLTGIATTYAGNDANYLKTYGLLALVENTNLYNSANHTLECVNLGIKPIYNPEYKITEDLKYVKIILNNHQYVYEYGSESMQGTYNAPSVSFESRAIKAYLRPVYPSSIYNLQHEEATNGKIEVYVVYEITINNLTNYQDEELYQEQALHIESLTNKYDTNRYTLDATVKSPDASTSFTELENNIKGDFGKWEDVEGEEGKVRYTGDEIVVGGGEKTTRYIQFKVTNTAIEEILNYADTGVTEDDPTTANTTGYHVYKRKDYSWENVEKHNTIPYEQEHKSVSQDDESSAPYLLFKLGEERKVSGIVFEDKVISTNNEKLGNGTYEADREGTVSGVKVELVDGTASNFVDADPTKLYNDENKTGKDAVTTTGEDGTFTLDGVMPGDYYLRLTYGDGSTCVVKPDGTLVSLKDYKSTIVTSDVAKNALGNGANQYGNEWYKHLENDNYSVAVDDLQTRADYNSGDDTITEMIAGTAVIDVTIENTTYNYTGDAGEEVNGNIHESLFGGLNFGIIVQPEQKITTEKKITNVKLVNTQNNTIFEGNPETDPLVGVTDLDGKQNQGSSYTRMEVEEDSIYGSKLTLTYDIVLKNDSNLNYYEIDNAHYGWYYMFGEHDESYSRKVQINIDEVIDCYDPVLTYISENGNITKLSYSEAIRDEDRNISISKQKDLANEREPDKYSSYEEVLSITGWGLLEIGNSKSTTFSMQKTLSTTDADLDFINVEGVSKMNIATSNDDEGNTDAQESLKLVVPTITTEPAKAEATVTAPTGSDKQQLLIIYGVAGIVMLIVLTTGIVIIKKKVL